MRSRGQVTAGAQSDRQAEQQRRDQPAGAALALAISEIAKTDLDVPGFELDSSVQIQRESRHVVKRHDQADRGDAGKRKHPFSGQGQIVGAQ